MIQKFLGHPLTARYRPVFTQFVKFCMVGVSNLLIYLGVYWLATRLGGLHYLPGSIVGFVVAVSWSFMINLHWTFKPSGGFHHRQYIAFIVANLITLVFNLAILTALIELFGTPDIIAQVIASVAGSFVNFSINRYWTFREKV